MSLQNLKLIIPQTNKIFSLLLMISPASELPHNLTYQVPAAMGLTSKSLLVAGFKNRNVKAMQKPV